MYTHAFDLMEWKVVRSKINENFKTWQLTMTGFLYITGVKRLHHIMHIFVILYDEALNNDYSPSLNHNFNRMYITLN